MGGLTGSRTAEKPITRHIWCKCLRYFEKKVIKLLVSHNNKIDVHMSIPTAQGGSIPSKLGSWCAAGFSKTLPYL